MDIYYTVHKLYLYYQYISTGIYIYAEYYGRGGEGVIEMHNIYPCWSSLL